MNNLCNVILCDIFNILFNDGDNIIGDASSDYNIEGFKIPKINCFEKLLIQDGLDFVRYLGTDFFIENLSYFVFNDS